MAEKSTDVEIDSYTTAPMKLVIQSFLFSLVKSEIRSMSVAKFFGAPPSSLVARLVYANICIRR